MPLRLKGILLFLPLPIGLYLLLAQPGNALVAVIVGAVMVAVHGHLTARPVDADIDRRCVWSGREIAPGCGYRVTIAGTTRVFNSYNDVFRDRAARYFTFAQRMFWPLRVAVIAPLAFFVVMEVARHSGGTITDAVFNQRVLCIGIAAVALFILIGQRFVEPVPHNKGPVRYPFQPPGVAFLGIFWTLTLAALFGAWWTYSVVRAAL